jgi:hypothetical protein
MTKLTLRRTVMAGLVALTLGVTMVGATEPASAWWGGWHHGWGYHGWGYHGWGWRAGWGYGGWGRACPPGFHLGPWGLRCWPNY